MNAIWKTASQDGDARTILDLLCSGADVDARDHYGQTALMLAAQAGHREVVETLLAHRANLNITAKFGLSALMLAVTAGHVEVARMLAKVGSDLTLQGTGAPGFAGLTAHDLAMARGLQELSSDLKPQPDDEQ